MLRTVCLIGAGLSGPNLRLQPWRYLWETARQLAGMGHPVWILTDRRQELPGMQAQTMEKNSALEQDLDLRGGRVWRLQSLQPGSPGLRRALEEVRSDVLLWHTGLSSFLHQDFTALACLPGEKVGIFTTPLYRTAELRHLKRYGLRARLQLCALPALPFTPVQAWLAKRLQAGHFERLVVQSQTSALRLIQDWGWGRPVEVIPPGVDPIWARQMGNEMDSTRKPAGFSAGDFVIAYPGPPDPLRGIEILLDAFRAAHRVRPEMRLLLLLRQDPGEPAQMGRRGRLSLKDPEIAPYLHLETSSLAPIELVRWIASADLVALPYLLTPSDVPLCPLETQALGKPVVLPRMGSLVELAGWGQSALFDPGDPASLAHTLLDCARCQPGNPQRAPFRSWSDLGRDWSALVESL